MEGANQIFGSGPIVQDYERDPVFISLKTANSALQKQVDDLNKRLVFTEALLVKRLNVNFDAAVKDMCQFVKKDKDLSKRLEESLRSQNTPNTIKLLVIFMKETGPEEGFVVCNKPMPSDAQSSGTNPNDIHDELNYYLEKIKGQNLSSDSQINIQNTLDEASVSLSGSPFNLGYYAFGTLKVTWVVSKFIYKESIRLGTFVLAATPLILFCVLVNEINKLTKGWAFQTAISGVGLIGTGLGKFF